MSSRSSQTLHFDRLSASLVSGETRPYIRVGSSNRPAQDEEVRRLYVEGSEGGFEALPCRGTTLADLSERLMADYIRRREETSGQPLGLSREEILRTLGCLVEQEGTAVPTNAGVMLFAEDPQRFVGQAEVACVRFKGRDVVSYTSTGSVQASTGGTCGGLCTN